MIMYSSFSKMYSLTPQLYIEVPVPSQESDVSVLGLSMLPYSTIFCWILMCVDIFLFELYLSLFVSLFATIPLEL